jgi:protein-L-isoaspartate(D-aspartate) O-methyltransferase
MPRSQEGLARLVEREGVSPRVVEAFRSIDRAEFVPEGARGQAYGDRPIAIPERQTTSQPSLIARMIDVAEVRDSDRVLEVGTGFGFQTALLARLGREVVSLDRFATLTDAARANLERLGITDATVLTGDGWEGCPECAPFDVIVVSAAASEVPQPLVEQLAEGGRLIIPLQGAWGDEVVAFVKQEGRLGRRRLITPARFVPLVPGEP